MEYFYFCHFNVNGNFTVLNTKVAVVFRKLTECQDSWMMQWKGTPIQLKKFKEKWNKLFKYIWGHSMGNKSKN